MVQEKLLDILEEICDDDAVRADLDMDLFAEGLLDSLAFAEMLVAIEDEVHITLSPTEYDKSQLSSVHKIEGVLKEKGIQ